MKFLTRLALLFYMVTLLFLSILAILFVLNVIKLDYVYLVLDLAYNDLKLRWVVGLIAGIIILKNYMFSRIISGEQAKERTIAFDNPVGRVTVALSAMDDMIRHLVLRLPEVKEAKPSIIATKKGLEITMKLVLKSDVNIPDMTLRLQEFIKRKVQETLGLEGNVLVRLHVSKIVLSDDKDRKDKDEGESSRETIPFQGYRA